MSDIEKFQAEYLRNNPAKKKYDICDVIEGTVRSIVKTRMFNSGSPGIIKGYFWAHTEYGGEWEQTIDEKYYSLLGGNDTYINSLYDVRWDTLKAELENRIINNIGFKYCEVRIENKTLTSKQELNSYTIFGNPKYKVTTTTGKAIWIHASMVNIGFSKR